MKERNRLTIAIDCDDVLLDTIKTSLEEYQKRYNVAISPDMCYSKDPSVWGVEDYSEALKRQYEIFSEVEFPPIPSSQEVLSRLSKNHDLWVLTGRHKGMAEMTKASINKYFPNNFNKLYEIHDNISIRDEEITLEQKKRIKKYSNIWNRFKRRYI